MIDELKDSIDYLRAPRDYFWQWAENGDVIEWRTDGVTICYQEVLFVLLKQLRLGSMPRIGPFLLVLYACQHRFGARERYGMLRIFGKFSDRIQEQKLEAVETFLRSIYDLPIELRTGPQRLILLRELFGLHKGAFNEEIFLQSVDELATGRWNTQITEFKEEKTINLLNADIAYFDRLRWQFPTTESLETMIRTGMKTLPPPAEIEVPETILTDLFDQLLEDPRTAGMSRIARNLLPVLNIPMHSLASGDQPIGGISDITNRGSYDKLLLSELAQDELLLTARLVNNEALYFRREEPPQHPERRKIILIDSTIKMWGIPRVFAISAALAFARNSKHADEIDAYVLGADVFEEVTLSEKKGVIHALERLHHGLHAGIALELAISRVGETANEIVLITEEKQLKSPAFHASFDKVRQQLSFLIMLNREGNISFSECTSGRAKLLNEAKLDLVELLFNALPNQPKRVRSMQSAEGLPAFLTKTPLPLLLLKKRIEPGRSAAATNGSDGMVVVTTNQRVLFIRKKGCAMEMLAYIESGSYFFNWSDPYICFILVRADRMAKLYKFDLQQNIVQSRDISLDLTFGRAVFSTEKKLYLFSMDERIIFDCKQMELTERLTVKEFDTKDRMKNVTEDYALPVDPAALEVILKANNPQGATRFDRVYISEAGNLVLGRFMIDFGEYGIRLSPMKASLPGKRSAAPAKDVFFKDTKCKYRTWTWPDGSEAVIDKRGVLHLRSSDPGLAEVSLILVQEVVTACWSSANEVCGNDSFINYELENTIVPPVLFYNSYIQPFINHIISNAAKS